MDATHPPHLGDQGLEIKMEAKTASKSAYTHAVIVGYAYSDRARGDVISKHKSYEAAAKKAAQSTFWAVREIAEVSNDSLGR